MYNYQSVKVHQFMPGHNGAGIGVEFSAMFPEDYSVTDHDVYQYLMMKIDDTGLLFGTPYKVSFVMPGKGFLQEETTLLKTSSILY